MTKYLKYEPELEFPEGWGGGGGPNQLTLHRRPTGLVWIFSGSTQLSRA